MQGRKIGRVSDYVLYSSGLSKYTVADKKGMQEPVPENFLLPFSYGPSAGGLFEPVLFKIATMGEVVNSIDSDPFFKARRLKVLGRRVDDALMMVERLNGPFSASHSIAFLGAVEEALGIVPSGKVLMGRVIELELERIRNHLHAIGRMCEAASFGVPYNSLLYLREQVNRVIGSATGHRFFYGVNGVSKINADFSGLAHKLSHIEKEARDTYESLQESKIFLDRLQGNGAIHDKESVGPVARASGFNYDARLDSQTLPYADLDFRPVVEDNGGDALCRFIVRFEEIFQSFGLVRKAEAALAKRSGEQEGRKKGPHGTGRVESPSGDVFYLVKLSNGRISNMAMLNSSVINLRVFEKSAQKNVFTDFHFNWESFGIWISEIAVNFV